jgi:hypothetical protein
VRSPSGVVVEKATINMKHGGHVLAFIDALCGDADTTDHWVPVYHPDTLLDEAGLIVFWAAKTSVVFRTSVRHDVERARTYMSATNSLKRHDWNGRSPWPEALRLAKEVPEESVS